MAGGKGVFLGSWAVVTFSALLPLNRIPCLLVLTAPVLLLQCISHSFKTVTLIMAGKQMVGN